MICSYQTMIPQPWLTCKVVYSLGVKGSQQTAHLNQWSSSLDNFLKLQPLDLC